MTCTALIKYERYAVEDPILDTALMIIDTMAYREIYVDPLATHEPELNLEHPWTRMMFIEDARNYCKRQGKTGYIWTHAGFKLAHDLLDALGMIAWHEYKVQQMLGRVF